MTKLALRDAGMPCDCWDSRCTQYAILLRRASFLMQTASKEDADMQKCIGEIERLVGEPTQSSPAATSEPSHEQ